MKFLQFIIIILLVSSVINGLYGQRIIKGRIIDENLDILVLADIYDSDTIPIGKTDNNGYFDIELSKDSNELYFGYIGYELTPIIIPDKCNYIELILMVEAIYDINSSRKIDRLRKKRFNNLNELHSEAFKQGLFKFESTCFQRTFRSEKPALDIIGQEMKALSKQNKKDFKELKIGDTVKIPFGIYKSGKKNSISYYSTCKNCKEENYDCIIECKIVEKYKKALTLELRVLKMCVYSSLEYRGKELNTGTDFLYETKYFEVIIDKKLLPTNI